MSLISLLQKKVDHINKKHESVERPEVFDYLNDQLMRYTTSGKVESVLVFDGHGKINCYGRKIREDLIHQKLNMSIRKKGTSVTGVVSYPNISRLTSYKQGEFTSRHQFTNNIEDLESYIALINIKTNPNDKYKGF